jgi:hypothetical protein
MSNNQDFGRGGIMSLISIVREHKFRKWIDSISPHDHLEPADIQPYLEHYVLSTLPRPWPVTASEFAVLVLDQIKADPSIPIEGRLVRLERLLISRCDHLRRSVNIVFSSVALSLRWIKIDAEEIFANIGCDGCVKCVSIDREHNVGGSGVFYSPGLMIVLAIELHCSKLAADSAAEEVSEIVTELFRLMFDIELYNHAWAISGLLGPETHGSGSAVADWLAILDDQSETEELQNHVRALSQDVMAGVRHVGKILEYAFMNNDRKGEFGKLQDRLGNAASLIVCAARVQNSSVALALYIAAIEALIVFKESGVSEEMSWNCAIILFDNGKSRESAIRRIKNLYDIRSKALHGERLAASQQDVANARSLCGAVLSAVVEWMRWHERLADVSQSPSLLKEMNEALFQNRRVQGIPDRLSHGLKWLRDHQDHMK